MPRRCVASAEPVAKPSICRNLPKIGKSARIGDAKVARRFSGNFLPGGTMMKKQAKAKPARRVTKPSKNAKPLKKLKKNKPSSAAAAVPIRPRSPELEERERQAALARENYDTAIRYLQEHKLERARALLEKVMNSQVLELADRARVHYKAVLQRLERGSVSLKSGEDYYNMGVALANSGRLDDSEQHLAKAIKMMPQAGYAYYALAGVLSMKRDIEGALANLKTAIDLDARNRFLARSDQDFNALMEDPRFADLVYPEKIGG